MATFLFSNTCWFQSHFMEEKVDLKAIHENIHKNPFYSQSMNELSLFRKKYLPEYLHFLVVLA